MLNILRRSIGTRDSVNPINNKKPNKTTQKYKISHAHQIINCQKFLDYGIVKQNHSTESEVNLKLDCEKIFLKLPVLLEIQAFKVCWISETQR